jgi:Anti-sigma factor NepR
MTKTKQPNDDSELTMSPAPNSGSHAGPETAEGETDPVPEWLQKGLKRLYTDVMDEPVPDDFARLLRQLEEKERQ